MRKRYSQDPDIEPADTDPEVYQGVLGRPGVDFPVMTTIPKTNFDCRSLGNGYFADLETSCQVTIDVASGAQKKLFSTLFPSSGFPHLRRRPQNLIPLSQRNDFPPNRFDLRLVVQS